MKVKDVDIAAIKKEMMRCYDPIEYDHTYWSQTDDVTVEYLTLMFWYLELFGELYNSRTTLNLWD
jgi:hypothetical protein